MSELRFSSPACAIAGKNRLTSDDVLNLRSNIFVDGITTSADATVLLAINSACGEKCPEWRDYFLDVMSVYIVQYVYPHGAMDDSNADWLVAMIAAGGVIRTKLEFDLLLRVIEISGSVPETLSVLALDQVRLAVSDDAGFWAVQRGTRRSSVVPEDIALIYTVLSLRSKANRHFMTVREIVVLKRIDAICQRNGMPPAWKELMRGVDVCERAFRDAQAAAA